MTATGTPLQMAMELFADLVDVASVPRILTDSGDLRGGAARIRGASAAVASATTAIGRTWSRLPSAMSASVPLDALYRGMDGPGEQGAALEHLGAAVARVLDDYAAAVEHHLPIMVALRAEVESFRAAALAEIAAATATEALVLDLPLAAAALRNSELKSEIDRRSRDWFAAQHDIATRLTAIRDSEPLALVTGSVTLRTAGLSTPRRPDPVDGADLLAEWLTGSGPRHRVFTGGDAFESAIRRSASFAAIRRLARERLGEGGWTLDVPLHGPFVRSVGGVAGLGTFLNDGRNLARRLLGEPTGNIDESYLGSYTAEIVPLAVVAPNQVLVRVTVVNATTLASGTRPPVIGYDPPFTTIGRDEDDSVPTGPLSETTQTITWTEVITHPVAPSDRSDGGR